MTDLVTHIAAVIQARSIARLGQAPPNHVCMDFAQAAVTAQREWDNALWIEAGPDHVHKQGDGIGGTAVCGKLSTEDGA